MSNLFQQNFTVGQKVTYVAPGVKKQKGIIKKLLPGQPVAWVVYNCGGDWENYQNYTASLTSLKNLEAGWPLETGPRRTALTSIESFIQERPNFKTQEDLVLQILERSKEPLTRRQIWAIMDQIKPLELNSAGRAVSDLLTKGKIWANKIDLCPTTNKKVRYYTLPPFHEKQDPDKTQKTLVDVPGFENYE
jgi:hypothetical protein